MDFSSASIAAGSSVARMKRRGRPPSSRNKPKVPAVGSARAGAPLRLVAPVQRKENTAVPRASTTLILWDPARSRAMAVLSPLVEAMSPPAPSGASIGRKDPSSPPSAGPRQSEGPLCPGPHRRRGRAGGAKPPRAGLASGCHLRHRRWCRPLRRWRDFALGQWSPPHLPSSSGDGVKRR
jgi:hypothetical protein